MDIKNIQKIEDSHLIIRVYGIVQGVGFRPFVSRIADANGVKGSVANKGSYVEIFASAEPEILERFLEDLENKAPERSAILKIDVNVCEDKGFSQFDIIESEKEAGDIFVSPDIATCPKCREELFDPNNRRYMHPFINCTACGPRLTILDSMPYDRIRTSMGEFPMCPECEYEYTHAETRRYDAQPVCCNDCGPEVYLLGRAERGREAITYVRHAIAEGKIVAIKGIGGFHLCCDATNEEAVARLRTLKQRPVKPFAVMMRDEDTVKRECEFFPFEEKELNGYQKPIILLKKSKSSHLAESVAPGNPKVGVMLPYAPVQMLLFDYNDGFKMPTDCFVMTSGNVSGAPICRTDEDALKEISGFCDIILSHDRKIRLRADDSVMDFYKEEPYMIRRSRGYAPLPVMTSNDWKGHVLAVGGELKNTFCIAKDTLLYQSPYVGDMEDIRTVNALRESIVRMEELLEAEPTLVVCDLHPRYNTTVVAEEQDLPLMQVQHHFAHVLSCMAENDVPENEKVIGVSFDGTGYGTDETIWGGEFLISGYDGFTRAGSIMPFLHVGGDIASKEGFRIAASMIRRLYAPNDEEVITKLSLCSETIYKIIKNMAAAGINAITSTSSGRLFDAVSAILNIKKVSTFEGEASTSLQFAADAFVEEYCSANCAEDAVCNAKRSDLSALPKYEEIAGEEFDLSVFLKMKEADDGRLLIATDELVKYIVDEVLKGAGDAKENSASNKTDGASIKDVDAPMLAYAFHYLLAKQICEAVRLISKETGINACALTGGVFQNSLLLKLCDDELTKSGLKVYRHSLTPPNDGGLALGQAAAGMYALNHRS